MLQRIQTLYFLGALIMMASALIGTSIFQLHAKTHYATISAYETVFAKKGTYELIQTNYFWLAFALVSVLIILVIFLYKNRKRQLLVGWTTLSLSLLTYGWIVSYYFFFKSEYNELKDASFQLGASFSAFSSFYFLALGIRGVRKDKALVDSLNRLR